MRRTAKTLFAGIVAVVALLSGGVAIGGSGYSNVFTLDLRTIVDPGQIDHLEVTGIPASVGLGDPFEITVTAKNATGGTVITGGTVLVNVPGCTVSPTRLTMTAGIATTDSARVQSGCGVALSVAASMSGAHGASAIFSVPCVPGLLGAVEGHVIDDAGVPIDGAVVMVTDGQGTPPTVQTAGGGHYRVAGVAPGSYTVQATFGDGQAAQGGVVIAAGSTVVINLAIPGVCSPSGPVPILLVPGIMGSTILPLSPVPTLPRDEVAWDDWRWPNWSWTGLGNPGGLLDVVGIGWRDLASDLEGLTDGTGQPMGYKIGCSIFPVPYDWRMRPDQAASAFLKPWIDEAKRRTGTSKVNIIAHSMGGLVARAYVQSLGYASRNDIDKLIMVGTPNHGSAMAYFIWEGGSASKADEVGAALGGGWVPGYSLVASTLCRAYYWPLECYTDTRTYHMAHDWVPSLGALLWTDSFLHEGDTERAPSCFTEENSWLEALNTGAERTRLTRWDGSSSKVRTTMMAASSAGSGRTTLTGLEVGSNNCNRTLYKDGVPGDLVAGAGDGTVPESSADLSDVVSVTYRNDLVGEHMNLVGKYGADIIEALTGRRPSATSTRAAAAPQVETASGSLMVKASGGASVQVTDPLGRAAGFDPVSGQGLYDIPDAGISSHAGMSSVTIPNPTDGDYEVTLASAWPGVAQVTVDRTMGDSVQETHALAMVGASPFGFSVVLPTASMKAIVSSSPSAPTAVRAEYVAGTNPSTRLAWNTVAGAAKYRVYSVVDDEPDFTLRTETTAMSFDTLDAWAIDGSMTVHSYAVSAVDNAGTESFLSDVVRNDDRDLDGLTDGDEGAYGSDPANSDTDSDGLTDGNEVQRGTDPTAADSDNDGYSDGQEVAAGSDPTASDSHPQMAYLVPSVAHSRGAGTTQWRTDIGLVNASRWTANLSATYFDVNGSQAGPVTLTLAPSITTNWEDVLVGVFGVGTGDSRKGTLAIVSDAPLAIVSRTYNQKSATETFGQFYPTVELGQGISYGQVGYLSQLKKNATFRTNVGFANPGAEAAEVVVKLYGAGGRILGSPRTETIPAGRWLQLDDIFAKVGASGQDIAYATVQVSTAGASVWAYASVVDATTGDPTTVSVLVPPVEVVQTIPSVSHSPGANTTQWRTDVAVVNPGSGEVAITLTYFSDTGAPARTAAATLGSGATVEWQDVLVSMLGLGTGDSSKGTLIVSTSNPVVVTSRTYNRKSATETFGQSYPALRDGSALREEKVAVLPQLAKTSAFRANIGVVNLGTASGRVRITLYGADGTMVGSPIPLTALAGRWAQANDVFALANAGNRSLAYAIVEAVDEGVAFWAYASVIDAKTGDPTTIPMQEE